MNFEHICLLGDLNSRTGNIPDTLIRDIHTDGEIDTLDFDKGPRISKDKSTNTMGNELIRFLKTTQMAIVNGRMGRDKGIGNVTCKNASVVDYVLLSYDLFNYVSDFIVMNFNEMYSDVHCAVNVVFMKTSESSCDSSGCNNNSHSDARTDTHTGTHTDTHTSTHTNRRTLDKRVKWDTGAKTQFIDNLENDAIDIIDRQLTHLLDPDTRVNLNDVDSAVTDIGDIFINSAKKTDLIKTKKKRKKKYRDDFRNPGSIYTVDRRRNYFTMQDGTTLITTRLKRQKTNVKRLRNVIKRLLKIHTKSIKTKLH